MQTTRMQAVHQGIRHTLRIAGRSAERTRYTRRLILTGIKPRAYGFSVMGTSPSKAKVLRTATVKGLAIRKPAGCATVALSTSGYALKDPLLTHAIDNVMGFLEGVRTQGWSPSMIKAWNVTLDSMHKDHRWQRVAGPMASCQATLLGMGWTLEQPNRWCDPDGVLWKIQYGDPQLLSAMKEVLEVQFKKWIWKQVAAEHFAGPTEEPDFVAYYRLRREFRKSADYRRAYFLDVVVQGGIEEYITQHIVPDDSGAPTCRFCKQTVKGLASNHLIFNCKVLN